MTDITAVDIYDDFYEISTELIEKYGYIYRHDIITSLLNVVLVLTGARKACIIDNIRDNALLLNELLEILLNYYNLSIMQLTAVEFLVFLTINKNYVEQEYKINRANVLEYCYNKNDFANINIDRIAVEYIAKSIHNNATYTLFTTVIPTYAYKELVIQQCIQDKIHLFNAILNNLDYIVLIVTRDIINYKTVG